MDEGGARLLLFVNSRVALTRLVTVNNSQASE